MQGEAETPHREFIQTAAGAVGASGISSPKQEHSHGRPPESAAPTELRARALEAVLLEKGLLASDAVDKVAEIYEKKIGPWNGAKVVARAWVDPAYKQRLLEKGTEAIAELGFSGMGGEHMVVVENTEKVHNVVCCSLCSCYPWPVLGLPPTWYKAPPYRARLVLEPRAVLREFGLELDPSVEIRVWDTNAEIRYLVLPQRPSGSEKLSEAELAALVTREAMIGVAKVKGVEN